MLIFVRAWKCLFCRAKAIDYIQCKAFSAGCWVVFERVCSNKTRTLILFKDFISFSLFNRLYILWPLFWAPKLERFTKATVFVCLSFYRCSSSSARIDRASNVSLGLSEAFFVWEQLLQLFVEFTQAGIGDADVSLVLLADQLEQFGLRLFD